MLCSGQFMEVLKGNISTDISLFNTEVRGRNMLECVGQITVCLIPGKHFLKTSESQGSLLICSWVEGEGV